MIGRMDQLITIQRRTYQRDTTGEMVPVWSFYAEVFARVYQRFGRERFEGNQNVAYRDDMARIYYDADINATEFRILINGETYNILSTKEVNRRRYLDLLLEVKDNG
jgi:SPP1 family predicted phage head-tail adaptor